MRRRRTVEGLELGDGVQALERALDAGGHRLDQAAARRARTLVGKVGERMRLSGEHTVVALAGATGSGKSSLFNAIAGLELVEAGARRPTTSSATACVWGAEGADELLDWLGVPSRHRLSHESQLSDEADDLRGLVLLDLPDHDSTEVAHRLEVDRLVGLVDVLVWVTDPQKYADAAVHRRYLSRLSGHDAVTVVLLNQADRLDDASREACLRDLTRLVRADGLRDAEVLPTSAVRGDGLPHLRELLGDAVGRRVARTERLVADLRHAAGDLRPGVGDRERDPDDAAGLLAGTDLVRVLGDVAGVPAVVQAVQADAVRAAVGTAGWPVTSWVRRLRPDPLRRLRLDHGTSDDAGAGSSSREALATSVRRSSLPPPGPTQLARLDLATRQVATHAADGLPRPWQEAVRAAAMPSGGDLVDAVDQAVVGPDLGRSRRGGWRVLGAGQLLLALAAAVGLVWLVALAVVGALGLPDLPTPEVGVVPLPTLLLVGGLLLGFLLGLLVGALARVSARRRGARVRRRLDDAVAGVAGARVLEPVAGVLRDHRETRQALAVLASAPR
ncbi:GTPase [Angustibacter aerolatus]